MNSTLAIQELAIVVAAKNHNPTLLTPDFLKYSGIVPADWELARTPLLSSQVAQVAFTNGISLIAQPNAITFVESLSGKASEEVKISEIARKYVETLPNIAYQSVSIHPRSFLTFEEKQEDAACNYIASTLLSSSSWQDFGIGSVKAAVNLVYTLVGRQLNLTVNEVRLQLPEQEPVPAVLFSGNFAYEIAGDTESERLHHLYQLLENWLTDLETYRELVLQQMLGKQVNESSTSFPEEETVTPVSLSCMN